MKALILIAVIVLLSPVYAIQAYEPLSEQALTECYDLEVLEKLKIQQKYVNEKVKPELSALFQELQNIRATKAFKELGFSSKNKVAVEWQSKVEQCRDRLEADDQVPLEVKIVPATLLSLGLSWIRKDDSDSMVQWDLEQVQNGLDWYFGRNCL